MKHYNHALTLAFEVVSTNPSGPSIEEAMPALLRRVADLLLDRQEAKEALLSEAPFDTYEMEEAGREHYDLCITRCPEAPTEKCSVMHACWCSGAVAT